MRALIVTENSTLDGVIEASEGWFDVADTADADFMGVQEEHRNGADALLVGRETYGRFAGYWPQQTGRRDRGLGLPEPHREVRRVRTLPPPAWQNTTVLRGPLVQEVLALKERSGRAIVATGSITLVRALLQAGLVDEYRLFVYPVVLGVRRRLFEEATDVGPLHLVEARPFRSGIALLRYRPA